MDTKKVLCLRTSHQNRVAKGQTITSILVRSTLNPPKCSENKTCNSCKARVERTVRSKTWFMKSNAHYICEDTNYPWETKRHVRTSPLWRIYSWCKKQNKRHFIQRSYASITPRRASESQLLKIGYCTSAKALPHSKFESQCVSETWTPNSIPSSHHRTSSPHFLMSNSGIGECMSVHTSSIYA